MPMWSKVYSAGLSLIHISEPTRLRRISYAVFCLKKKNIKGVDKLIMALPHILTKIPKAKLVIVGVGDLQEYLSNLTKTIRLDEYVKFCFDFMPEEERILHYAACDIAVFPSFYEPFGIVALE